MLPNFSSSQLHNLENGDDNTPYCTGYFICQCLVHGKYSVVAVFLLWNTAEVYSTVSFLQTQGSETLSSLFSANSPGMYIFMP